MRSPFVELLAALAGVLGELGVRWYLFGAQAALIHGAVRLTADVDVTLDLEGRAPEVLVRALEAAGFRMRVEGADFIQRTRVLPVLHVATGVPADLVIAGPGIEEMFLDRVEVRDFEGVRVPVARAEDVVVMKILAGRPKDTEDVVAMVTARADLDLDQVRSMLRLIEQTLDQSDLLPELARIVTRARGTARPPARRPPRGGAAKKTRKPSSR